MCSPKATHFGGADSLEFVSVCVASYDLHNVGIIRVGIEIIVGRYSFSYILITMFDQYISHKLSITSHCEIF